MLGENFFELGIYMFSSRFCVPTSILHLQNAFLHYTKYSMYNTKYIVTSILHLRILKSKLTGKLAL